MYTDMGYMKDGVWKVTGASWKKGNCIVEFERHCEEDDEAFVMVQDTDEVRPNCHFVMYSSRHLRKTNSIPVVPSSGDL